MLKALSLLAALSASLWAAPPIRVLIVSGQNNHDWRTTTPELRKLLNDSGRFDVRVTEEPRALDDRSLTGYDVLVLDYNGPRWGPAAERAVENFVRSGKGLVAVHGASYAFGTMEILADQHLKTGRHEPPWPAYADLLGASWSEASGHAPRHIFDVQFTDSAHPIASGLGARFTVSDELYHRLQMQPGVHVIATAQDDKSIGGTGLDEPVLWTVAYGQGRVFHTALGHDVSAMREPGFISTFVRGTEWAATGAVAPPGNPGPEPLRVLVVTGGHNHETTFYTMLEELGGFTIDVNPHPVAFNGDLVKNFDVLVLYDMVQKLDDAQRAHLRAFAEHGGKGIVALHHCIASFADWPWFHELIGGQYFEKAREGHPASTYIHDQELRVTTVGNHAIVRGIPPMHLWDETYKGMWISPEAQVLLKTDNPTSDGPVAWISPYQQARIVYIQLGHGHTSHTYPAFRQFVRNSLLWAGGR